ncbi:MAG: hypothetical protein ACJA2G_002089 [Cognaticolwellia sp.]|jgi:hypothetical protein
MNKQYGHQYKVGYLPVDIILNKNLLIVFK